jgi:glutathione synthase/RimK-type ligase-like ATP-grasp enzyme
VFATCADVRELTEDDRRARDGLVARGFRVDTAVWDDDDVPWAVYAAVVVRSCWDYHRKVDRFRDWLNTLDALEVPLYNDSALVRWNMDKRYLRSLAERGAAVVPTRFVEKSERADLGALLRGQGWPEAVVKPSISASAYDTWIASAESAEDSQLRLEEMLGRGGVLVQEFVPEIRTDGEWSLVFFGGTFSHAMRKRPRAGDFRVQEEYGGQVVAARPAPSLIEDAAAILHVLERECVYARVDGVAREGRLLLMELELIEPYLYFAAATDAPSRFADEVVRRLEKTRSAGSTS